MNFDLDSVKLSMWTYLCQRSFSSKRIVRTCTWTNYSYPFHWAEATSCDYEGKCDSMTTWWLIW